MLWFAHGIHVSNQCDVSRFAVWNADYVILCVGVQSPISRLRKMLQSNSEQVVGSAADNSR